MAVQLPNGDYVFSDEEQTQFLSQPENRDVLLAISRGDFANVADHFNTFGKNENRKGVPNLENLDGTVTTSIANPDGTVSSQTFTNAPPSGNQTFSFTAPDPVDLTPVTSAIGTPGTGQADTLMGQTQGLATGQQGIRDVVDPLAGQVRGIGTSIGTAGTGQADTLMGQTADIQSGIGQAGEGQTDLFAGQRGIMSGIGTAGEGQTDLFAGQAGLAGGQTTLSENQVALQEGQAGLGEQIGTAAVTGEDGTVTQQPTGLYAGQAGLMSGQTGLTQDISGLGRDLSGIGDQLSGDLSGLGSQLGAFRTAAEQYQRGATTQRGDIQGTQRAGQAALTAQVQGVGQQANRAAEAIAQQRQQQQQPAVQQQAAQFAQSAPRATPSNQQVGPMGPMAADPRDALIQQLLTRNASLMNNRPV
tara:strand:+ start:753 stop:2000 length:1248 start_codon:yes stop_codon:yes gene_type:complete